jgi:hypothetical protein
MLWRRVGLNNRYEYVAVMKIRETSKDNFLYGEKEFVVELADGTTQTVVLRPEVWRSIFESVTKAGGYVLNA